MNKAERACICGTPEEKTYQCKAETHLPKEPCVHCKRPFREHETLMAWCPIRSTTYAAELRVAEGPGVQADRHEYLAKRVELLAQGEFTDEWNKGYKAATVDAAAAIRDDAEALRAARSSAQAPCPACHDKSGWACELKAGHNGKHLAGTVTWGRSSAQGEQA